MIIKKIRCLNFQSYPSAEVSLLDGPICIVGRNMSGKSSLARMIDWGLTGSFSSPNITKFTKDMVRPTGVTDPTIVELTVSNGAGDYLITRILDKKETIQIRYPEGVLFTGEDAETKILEIAKVSKAGTPNQRKELFSRTFWLGVGQQTSFFSAKPSERKEILEAISPFKKFAEMEATAAERIKELDETLSADEMTLVREEGILSSKTSDIESLIESEAAGRALIAEYISVEELSEAEKIINSLAGAVAIEEDALRKRAAIESELKTIETEDLSQELATLKDKEVKLSASLSMKRENQLKEKALLAEVNSARIENELANDSFKEEQSSIKTLLEAVEFAEKYCSIFSESSEANAPSGDLLREVKGLNLDLQAEVLRLEEEHRLAVEKLQFVDSDYNDGILRLSSLKKELELGREKALKILDTVDGKADGETCDHCGGVLSKELAESHLVAISETLSLLEDEEVKVSAFIAEMKGSRFQILKQIEDLEASLAVNGSRLERIKSLSIEVLSKQEATYLVYQGGAKEAEHRINLTNATLTSKRAEIESLTSDLSKCTASESDLALLRKELKEIEVIQERNTTLLNRKKLLEAEFKRLANYSAEGLKEKKDELSLLKENYTRNSSKLNLKNQVTKLLMDIDSVRDRIAQKSSVVDIAQKRRRGLSIIKGLLAKNGDARTMALANDVSNLVSMTNESLSKLGLNKNLAVDLKLMKEDKKEDGEEGRPIINLRFEVDGQCGLVTPSNSQLKVVGMAMDLAVAKLGGSDGFLIVDEPEEGLDDINRSKVTKFLRDSSQQTILVTNSAAAGFENIVTTDMARSKVLTIADFDLKKLKSSKVKKKDGRITEASEATVDQGEL